jgi:hypothetical protein
MLRRYMTMRFPLYDQLDLPCVFEQLVPGQLHSDGRRYLPQIMLRPTGAGGLLLGVVDRHHRVALAEVGRAGTARLICALGVVRAQTPPYRLGLAPPAAGWRGGACFDPLVLGRVLELAAWEPVSGPLAAATIYVELSLEIGLGVVGLRANLSQADLGAQMIAPGDHLELTRTRIDVLGFDVAA